MTKLSTADAESNWCWRLAAWLLLHSLLLTGCAAQPAFQHQSAPATPAELYGELFRDVQLGRVFPDSKTFVDTVARRAPADILAAYQYQKSTQDFDLRAFVEREFVLPVPAQSNYRSVPGEPVVRHIDKLWDVLTRAPVEEPDHSSRLPLPYRYVVPGGRFNEMYYWDSYFTMLGLEASGRHELVRAMCDNFAALIGRYGHIPNGNRSYYLSRSQPPFFAAMVELLVKHEGEAARLRYRNALHAEHAFWMQGESTLSTAVPAHRRVVRLSDGAVLNRYWDDRATPREESYREDIETAGQSGRPAGEVYRNLRAAAESGWDFSSRWFTDGSSLATIRTVELVPPDLNSLIHRLERTLELAYAKDDPARAAEFAHRAAARREAIQRYLWDSKAGAFTDYLWRTGRSAANPTAATVVPLYFGVADETQAATIANTLSASLLARHGLLTSTRDSGQQWDAPNGWAPLQWMAIEGLRRYGHDSLAREISERWIAQNLTVFRATGKLVEKYDVAGGEGEAGGGEYPLQDGFGWTNGVLRALLAQRSGTITP